MGSLDYFSQYHFINLETFRKNGLGVRTPVWFVMNNDSIFVRTGDNSGKVKRIRNNSRVNIAPCQVDGTLLDGWITLFASIVSDHETDEKVDYLLDEKYGPIKKQFTEDAYLKGIQYCIIEIKERKNDAEGV
jgi:uncharacterized protein